MPLIFSIERVLSLTTWGGQTYLLSDKQCCSCVYREEFKWNHATMWSSFKWSSINIDPARLGFETREIPYYSLHISSSSISCFFFGGRASGGVLHEARWVRGRHGCGGGRDGSHISTGRKKKTPSVRPSLRSTRRNGASYLPPPMKGSARVNTVLESEQRSRALAAWLDPRVVYVA